MSADNNFNVDTGSSATSITVTGTGNLDTTSADTSLTTDTLTFDGQSIATNILSGQTDVYGRTYTVSGSTLTITTASGSALADTLTIDGFVAGDFGVNTAQQIAVPDSTQTVVSGMNDNGVVVGSTLVNGLFFDGRPGRSEGFTETDGAYTIIDAPGDGYTTSVNGINDAGEMVGISNNGVVANDNALPERMAA